MSEEKQKKINLNIFKNIPKDETDTILDEDLFGREVKLDEKISDFIQVFKSKWLESQTYFVNIVKKKSTTERLGKLYGRNRQIITKRKTRNKS